jgi:molybdate transport system regulatory protein
MSNDSKHILKYHIKTRVFYDNPNFGPGVSKIMELVKETGRLSEAYKIMGLSSSKGWKIIKKAEEDLGFPLFVSVVGGKGGGKSELSPEGADLLDRYQAFVCELNTKAEKLFNKYFEE